MTVSISNIAFLISMSIIIYNEQDITEVKLRGFFPLAYSFINCGWWLEDLIRGEKLNGRPTERQTDRKEEGEGETERKRAEIWKYLKSEWSSDRIIDRMEEWEEKWRAGLSSVLPSHALTDWLRRLLRELTLSRRISACVTELLTSQREAKEPEKSVLGNKLLLF